MKPTCAPELLQRVGGNRSGDISLEPKLHLSVLDDESSPADGAAVARRNMPCVVPDVTRSKHSLLARSGVVDFRLADDLSRRSRTHVCAPRRAGDATPMPGELLRARHAVSPAVKRNLHGSEKPFKLRGEPQARTMPDSPAGGTEW